MTAGHGALDSGNAVAIDALVAQPTIPSVARSISTARYSQPDRVEI